MNTLLDNSPAARRERFTVILTAQFERPEFAAAIQRYGQCENIAPESRTARAYAEFYVAELIAARAEWKGVAVQAACRALGVGKTMKALREFLIGVRE